MSKVRAPPSSVDGMGCAKPIGAVTGATTEKSCLYLHSQSLLLEGKTSV